MIEQQNMTVGQGHLAHRLVCQGCAQGCIVVERFQRGFNKHPDVHHPVFWWPVPEGSEGVRALDPAVPIDVAEAYAEATRCIDVHAPRAAAVMLRAMLAFLVAARGSDEAKAKKSLASRLRQMAQDGSLYPGLAEWADAVRIIGNGGAHPDELPNPTMDEVTDLARLCRQVIAYVFEFPAQVKRSRTLTPL